MNAKEIQGDSAPSVKVAPAPTAAGLEGVIVAETQLSHVDGERGELVIAGTRAEVWALEQRATFETAAGRLLSLGSGTVQPDLHGALGEARCAAFTVARDLDGALQLPDAMDSLLACVTQGSAGAAAIAVLGALPVYVAASARRRAGLPLIAPDRSRGHAEDFLAMLGLPHSAARVGALNAYWVTVSDHGLNASTFAARVVASTGSDVVSCVAAGLGALKGPLHGGAPGPVLDMLDLTRDSDPRAWLEAELAQGRRIMGIGHRIYRVRDPRALVFERALTSLADVDGERAPIAARLAHARRVEQAAVRLLSERHPERPLHANVEFYTALLLEALAIPRSLFTATFAVGRAAGWLAHVAEQRRAGKLIRPASRYVGALPD